MYNKDLKDFDSSVELKVTKYELYQLSKMVELTESQSKVYDEFVFYHEENGGYPTLRFLSEKTGLSPQGVADKLSELRDLGFLEEQVDSLPNKRKYKVPNKISYNMVISAGQIRQELAQYKRMLGEGIITQEDFDNIKKKLLPIN